MGSKETVQVGEFKVALYMKPFYPSDIQLQVVDRMLILHAKHEEHIDPHGFVTRELVRKYELPEDISINMVESYYFKNGIMVIYARKQQET